MKDKPKEKLSICEYHCSFCETTFYTDYGKDERCCYCGSTSEVKYVRSLNLTVDMK